MYVNILLRLPMHTTRVCSPLSLARISNNVCIYVYVNSNYIFNIRYIILDTQYRTEREHRNPSPSLFPIPILYK